MTLYVGILDGAGDVWGVRIPDVPGAYGGGETPETAIASAIAGLTAWAEATIKDGEAIPKPRSLADLIGEIEPHEAAIQIPLVLDAGRSVRANVTFDAGLLDAIDTEATRRGLTRSAFLASAARDKKARGG
jgi:predicted RNase H-like HicB family nuclease